MIDKRNREGITTYGRERSRGRRKGSWKEGKQLRFTALGGGFDGRQGGRAGGGQLDGKEAEQRERGEPAFCDADLWIHNV